MSVLPSKGALGAADRSVILSQASMLDVACLAKMATDSDPHAWTESAIRSAFGTNAEVWMWQDDLDRPIGFAVFQCVLDECELLYVVVARAWQGQGLGGLLLQQCFARLSGRGIQQCFLEVRESHVGAQKLYQRLGFEVVGMRKGYYPNGLGERENALLMRLDSLKEG